MTRASEVRMAVEAGIQPLQLRYMPVLDVRNRTPEAYRTAVRVNSTVLGTLGTAQYAGAAEHSPVGAALSRWGVGAAIDSLETLNKAERFPSFVTARCTVSWLSESGFPAELEALMKQKELSVPERLCLEFSPAVLSESSGTVWENIRETAVLGVRTLITGCGERDCALPALLGTGLWGVILSPYATTLSDNADYPSVFGTLVQYLRSMRLRIFAQGVSNSGQLDMLSRLECDGYIPAAEFEGAVQTPDGYESEEDLLGIEARS